MQSAVVQPWWPAITSPRRVDVGASSLRGAVLGHAIRWFHRRELTAVARGQLLAAESLGSVENRDDLLVALDEVAGRAELGEAAAALARLGTSPLARLRPKRRAARDSMWQPLGPVAAKVVALGFMYAYHAGKAAASLPQPEVRELDVADWAEGILIAVRAPETPVEIAGALLAMRRIPASLIALLRALEQPSTFPKWVVLELAERFMLGERAILCLLAAAPGVAIPDDVLPREHRLDALAAQQRNEAQLAAWDALPVAAAVPEDEMPA